MPTEASAPSDEFLNSCRTRVETALNNCLPSADRHPVTLHQAMRYSVLNGGKRIRPLLVYAAGHAAGACLDALDAPACAVELIHAYSLIHDDLPAMDDDDLRRGKPACHRAFDEAQAILAGDALQALAFEVISAAELADHSQRTAAVQRLARAAGARGMVGGQSIDLLAIGGKPDIAELEDMHIRKTGALLRASVLLGAIYAPEPAEQTAKALDRFGKSIGLAFQVRDDLLDVTGDSTTLGKQAGADAARHKPTYPSLLGIDETRELLSTLHTRAIDALEPLGDHACHLREIANLIVVREH